MHAHALCIHMHTSCMRTLMLMPRNANLGFFLILFVLLCFNPLFRSH